MVPQQVNLFSGTIRENLLLADPNANDEKLKEALSEAGLGSIFKDASQKDSTRMWEMQEQRFPVDSAKRWELLEHCFQRHSI